VAVRFSLSAATKSSISARCPVSRPLSPRGLSDFHFVGDLLEE
jgi:hypothetical protein